MGFLRAPETSVDEGLWGTRQEGGERGRKEVNSEAPKASAAPGTPHNLDPWGLDPSSEWGWGWGPLGPGPGSCVTGSAGEGGVCSGPWGTLSALLTLLPETLSSSLPLAPSTWGDPIRLCAPGLTSPRHLTLQCPRPSSWVPTPPAPLPAKTLVTPCHPFPGVTANLAAPVPFTYPPPPPLCL